MISGIPVTKAVVLVVPAGLVLTNISASGSTVTLRWQGVGFVQAQVSSDFVSWSDTGLPTSGNVVTVARPPGAVGFFRLHVVPEVAPGECVLQRMFGGTNSNGGATTKSCALDHAGNLITAGLMYYSVDLGAGVMSSAGGQDAFVAKYSADGVCLWSKRFGNVSNDSASGVAVDSADNIVVVGSFSGPTFPGSLDFGLGPMDCKGGSDVFVVKLSSAGAVLWSRLFGGSGADQGVGVAVDVVDAIFLTGTHGFFGTGADFGGGVLPTFGQQDVFLTKLSAAGNHVWSKSCGGSDSDLVSGLAVDMVNPIICGAFRGSANFGAGTMTSGGDTDAYVAHYSGVDGSAQWVQRFGDVRGQTANGVCVDGAGSVAVCGDFLGSMDFGSGYVATAQGGGSFYAASFDAAGTVRWVRDFGAPDSGPHAAAVCITQRGPCVVGEMITGIDFGTGYLLGQGGNDAMLVQFDNTTGDVVWAKRGGPFGDRATAAAAVGPKDQGTKGLRDLLIVSGDCGSQPVDFGCSAVVTAGGTVSNGFWVGFSQ